MESKGLWSFILRLFGIGKSEYTSETQNINEVYNRLYEDINKINYAAIFANKLSSFTISESDIEITGDNMRADAIEHCADDIWAKMKKIVARAFGSGGCVVIPYVDNGEIMFNFVSQDRLCINEKRGDKITSCTILSDVTKINKHKYYRWTTYQLVDGVCYIRNMETDSTGNPTNNVSEWMDIEDMSIGDCDQLPIAYIKCPKDNRRTIDDYGVPITYGCGEIIDNIRSTLKQIVDEYELKQPKLILDERALKKDKNGKVKNDRLYLSAHSVDNSNLFEIFDPAIRDSSFFSRLNQLYSDLEKEVGTSTGILTERATYGSTATEIKAAMYDTYIIVDDMRKNVEAMVKDYLRACDILLNYYSITPVGEYNISYDWNFGLIESSTETWQQLKDGQAIGIYSKAELRQWQTGEDIATAQERILEIEESEPTLSSLIGNA